MRSRNIGVVTPNLITSDDIDAELADAAREKAREKDRQSLNAPKAFIVLLLAIVSCAIITAVIVSYS
jgi:hypothetical protein